MKSLRNAPSVWLDKAGIPDVFDQEGVWVGGWGPLVRKNPTDDPGWKPGVWLCLI